MAKNILELCLSPNLGGLELFLYHCYRNFRQKGSCKIVIEEGKKLDNYFESEDKFYLKRNKFFAWIPALQLARYIDVHQIDVVHFHWTRDMLTVVLAKLFSKRKPKIVQSRHMGMTRFKDDFYHRFVYKHITMMHAITKEVVAQLQRYIPQEVRPKIELVYLGVEPKKDVRTDDLRTKYALEKSFVLSIVGRIQEGKDQHIVIEAIAKLKELDLNLFIVGESMDADYLAYLKELCHTYGVEERVFFTGFTKEVDRYMALSDVTVLATKNEAFGLVIIESMANKTPVIATNRGGPLEIIDDGIDGLLYDATAEDLAQKIALLYHDREKLQALSEAAFCKVTQKFDFQKQLEKLYNVIVKDTE